MKSMSTALLWEMSRHWYWFVLGYLGAASFPFLALFSLTSLGMPPDSPEFIRIHAFLMPFHFLILLLGVHGLQGPIQRLYGYPLSNATIAFWTMGSGLAMLTCGILSTLCWFQLQFETQWPWMGPILYFAMSYAIFQPITRVAHHTVGSIMLIPLLAILLAIGFVTRYEATSKLPVLWNHPSTTEILCMVIATIVSTILFVKSVAMDRHGEDRVDRIADRFFALQSYLYHYWMSRKHDRTQFSEGRLKSGVDAHRWYVWMLHERAYLCVLVGIFAIGTVFCIMLGESEMPQFKPDPRLNAGWIMVLFWTSLIALTHGIGLGMMSPDGTMLRRRMTVEESLRQLNILKMGSFLSSLPIRNDQLSLAILYNAAKGSLVVTALTLLSFGCISVFKVDLFSGLWTSSYAPWCWMGLFILPWTATCCTATICLFGRVRLALAPLLLVIVAMVLIAIPEAQGWCFVILALSLFLGVMLAMLVGIQSRELSVRRALISMAGWISMLCMFWTSSPIEVTTSVLCWMVLLATAAILPIIVMPVAIAWNRHR